MHAASLSAFGGGLEEAELEALVDRRDRGDGLVGRLERVRDEPEAERHLRA